MKTMNSELDVLQVEKKIRGRVKQEMEKSQRENLNEQMKAIQKELGEIGDEPNDFDAIQKRIDSAGLSKEAKEKLLLSSTNLK